MKILSDYFRELGTATVRGWNRFWFEPRDPATVGLLRILSGAMLLYTHLVWSLRLEDFFGANGWLAMDLIAPLRQDQFAWSILWLVESPGALWTVHVVGLICIALYTLGLFSRVTSVMSFVFALSYANRGMGAMFGLDQINCLLVMYLMLAPSGARYSLDRYLASRRRGKVLPVEASVGANVATRLIQLHMCVIYFFAGTSKLMGPAWWNGEAMWMAFGNLEYQSLDMTWMVEWQRTVNFLTHITIAWELSYCALVWPRLTRPIMIALAVPLHLGIAVCLGMITFGTIMIVANMAFLSPWLVRAVIEGRTPPARPVSETEPPADGTSRQRSGKKRRRNSGEPASR